MMRDKQPPYEHFVPTTRGVVGRSAPAKVSQEAEQYLYQIPVFDPNTAATKDITDIMPRDSLLVHVGR